jgi:hypothetical protein
MSGARFRMMDLETTVSGRRCDSMFIQVSFLNKVDPTFVASVGRVEVAEMVIEMTVQLLEVARVER